MDMRDFHASGQRLASAVRTRRDPALLPGVAEQTLQPGLEQIDSGQSPSSLLGDGLRAAPRQDVLQTRFRLGLGG